MTFGSLFAGIGGFDLGLERAGMECRWQVEIDPFCRAVLAKHWPNVRRYEDVRTVGAHNLERVDVICGGFPCQDISLAGKGAGIYGERSGLWSEYDRLIGELRPRYVVVENVAALLGRGLGRVLGDLAARRYDAEWDCLPALSVGAPHRRDRVWIVAYPGGEQYEGASVANQRPAAARLSRGLADTNGERLPSPRYAGKVGSGQARIFTRPAPSRDSWWATEPDVGRVAHVVPARVDRLRGLGNAIVPQIAEWIGKRIIEADKAMRDAA